jgi:N,N'-diacetyllegionaminate synthase
MKIIAELCQNHNGSFENVKRMVDQAALSGATHVKIQTIYAQNLAFRPQFEEGLEQDGRILAIKRPWQAEYDRLKKLELTPEQCAAFVECCRQAGVEPLTTCFARGNVKEIRDQGFRMIKVASYDCASYPLLRELAANYEFLFVSTGATFEDEIRHASSVLQQAGADFAFLHCVTIYPTPLDEMHLARLSWLRQFAPYVGFSDHSLVRRDGIIAAKAAIALGAEVVERHFTILGPEETKDGPVSISPDQLRELCAFAKLPREEQLNRLNHEHPGWNVVKGRAQREMSDAELLNRDYYRGRFATPRQARDHRASTMIFNWEETPA